MLSSKEAKARLKEIANGEYHTVHWKLCEHTDGEVKQTCQIYIDGNERFYEGTTWELAFEARELALKNKEPVPQETIEHQMPK